MLANKTKKSTKLNNILKNTSSDIILTIENSARVCVCLRDAINYIVNEIIDLIYLFISFKSAVNMLQVACKFPQIAIQIISHSFIKSKQADVVVIVAPK